MISKLFYIFVALNLFLMDDLMFATNAALDVAKTIYQVEANNQAIDKYNQQQKELAQYQNEYNLSMWNLSNEYNSPASQMNRLFQAGLNPNLVYGNGSVANTAGMPARAERPDLKRKEYDLRGLSTLAAYTQIARLQKDIDVADQNIKESQAREDSIRESTYGQGLQNKWFDATWDKRYDELYYKVENEIADNNYKLIVRGYLPDMQEAELKKLNQYCDNLAKEYDNLCKKLQLTDAQIEYTWKQADVADAMTEKIAEETGLTWNQAQKVYYETMGTYIENHRKVFNMYMDASKYPTMAVGIAAGTQTGMFQGWQDALNRAQGAAMYGLPPEVLQQPTRRRNKSRRR